MLRAGHHATQEDVCRLIGAVLAGEVEPAPFGAWLLALADLGESAAEIAGVARALRERMVPVPRHGLAATAAVADPCGTGGDGSGSVNISKNDYAEFVRRAVVESGHLNADGECAAKLKP